MRYAAKTEVSVERSQSEIMGNLRRYGADAWAFGEDQGCGIVRFRYEKRPIAFRIEMPDRQDKRFTEDRYGHALSEQGAWKRWDQACRQRWRALSLFILATLEAVESGILPPDEAFIAQTLIGDGETLAERFAPQIREAIENGTMPRLLLAGPAPGKRSS